METKDEILKLAKECGFPDYGTDWFDDRLKPFYRAAYNKAIEDAITVAIKAQAEEDDWIADQIRALEMK